MTVRCRPRLGLVALLSSLTLIIPAFVLGQTSSFSGDERSVPFERPAVYGDRAEVTAEEIAERAAREKTAIADDLIGPQRAACLKRHEGGEYIAEG